MSDSKEEVLGELTNEEKEELTKYQRRANQVVFEIGELEVRKYHLIQEAANIEQEAGSFLRAIGDRVGLQENQLFRVVDGKIVLAGQPQPKLVTL